MPDGDVVHHKLKARYLTPYKQVCEWKLGPRETAREILRRVKRGIAELGPGPFSIAAQVAELLSPLAGAPLHRACTDWAEIDSQIQKITRETPATRFGKTLICRAAREQMRAVQEGYAEGNILLAITQRFFRHVYAAEFAERVPLTSSHFDGVDNETVRSRLCALAPYVNDGLDYFATQYVRRGVSVPLRLRRESRKPKLSLTTDVFTMGE